MMAADTLPDILTTDLSLLSIGLNPSLPSVAAGFYFANPRNRFWTALNASTLLSEPVSPGPGCMQQLLEREVIFSDDLERIFGERDFGKGEKAITKPRKRQISSKDEKDDTKVKTD